MFLQKWSWIKCRGVTVFDFMIMIIFLTNFILPDEAEEYKICQF